MKILIVTFCCMTIFIVHFRFSKFYNLDSKPEMAANCNQQHGPNTGTVSCINFTTVGLAINMLNE